MNARPIKGERMRGIRQLFFTHRQKIKGLLLCTGGVVLLNAVLQLLVYPLFKRELGVEGFGVALSLMALLSLTAGALGNALGFARLFKKEGVCPTNADYTLVLLTGSLLIGVLGVWALRRMGGAEGIDALFFALLLGATAARCYSDVEFKQTGDALCYFAFYALLSLGYAAGLWLSLRTGRWMPALLVGELLAILFARIKSGIYHDLGRPTKALWPLLRQTGVLLLSALLEGLPFYADRLVLLASVGAEAVTVFYTASLFGKVAALLATPVSAVLVGLLLRTKAPLSRKSWACFLLVALAVGGVATLGCLLASHLFLPLLYGEVFAAARPILLPAILAQVLFFVSGVLMVVLLRYYGEKRQLFLNTLFLVLFFTLALFLTREGGLRGFVQAALLANALRLFSLAVCGFLPQRP